MEPKGQMLGFDIDDAAYIPVSIAMKAFNLPELTEVDSVYSAQIPVERALSAVRDLLMRRHDGNEDFTLLSQDAMLEIFGNIMEVITMSVGAIAGISLLVGAIGILTMMWISVGERTAEIGLVRALGATAGQVQFLFLVEAAALAMIGGFARNGEREFEHAPVGVPQARSEGAVDRDERPQRLVRGQLSGTSNGCSYWVSNPSSFISRPPSPAASPCRSMLRRPRCATTRSMWPSCMYPRRRSRECRSCRSDVRTRSSTGGGR